MHARAIRLFLLVFFVALASAAIGPGSQAQKDKTSRTPPTIPKTWDEEAIASLQVPLADASASPVQISADYYYR
ncbi:MAG: hypothetical protein ACREEM_48255, partial [Blastocatellia bacterium]